MSSPVEEGSFAYFDFTGLDNYTEKERWVIHDRLCEGWSIDVKTAKEFVFVVRVSQDREWTVRFDRAVGEFVALEQEKCMSVDIEASLRRSRAPSQAHTSALAGDLSDAETRIIQQHLGEGWIREWGDENNLVFSIRLEDGRKWIRQYDRKLCTFSGQSFHSLPLPGKRQQPTDWPSIDFGD